MSSQDQDKKQVSVTTQAKPSVRYSATAMGIDPRTSEYRPLYLKREEEEYDTSRWTETISPRKPLQSYIDEGLARQPSNHLFADNVPNTASFNFVGQCYERAVESNLGGYEEPYNRRFLGRLKVVLEGKKLRKLLEKNCFEDADFIGLVIDNLTIGVVATEKNTGSVALRKNSGVYHDYGFLLTEDNQSLKSEVIAMVENFIREELKDHWRTLPEKSPQAYR